MSNPLLGKKIFEKFGSSELGISKNQTMTVSGCINKSLFLTCLLVSTALLNSYIFFNIDQSLSSSITIGSAIVALVIAIILAFKKDWSKPLSIVYALFEGMVVGGVSAMFASLYNGIVFQAITITITVLFIALLLYKFRIIVVTQRFKSVIIIATSAIALIYLSSFILGFFNINLPFLHGNSLISIGINIVIIIVAALNLLLDFDFIEKGSEENLPKYFEWYASFGLLVTLVWLYLEVLRLLAKFKSRD